MLNLTDKRGHNKRCQNYKKRTATGAMQQSFSKTITRGKWSRNGYISEECKIYQRLRKKKRLMIFMVQTKWFLFYAKRQYDITKNSFRLLNDKYKSGSKVEAKKTETTEKR